MKKVSTSRQRAFPQFLKRNKHYIPFSRLTLWTELKGGIIFIVIIFGLHSCMTSPSEQLPITITALQGTWEEYRDPTKLYFAESTHTLTFVKDSFFLRIYEFTDIVSRDTCFPNPYTQYMKGSYSIVDQETIVLLGEYVDSLWNTMLACECAWGPRKFGEYTEMFHGSLDGTILHMSIISSMRIPEWVLKKRVDGSTFD